MQNNIARQNIALSSKAQVGSVHLRLNLCDRFQGALLGLSLAPVALSAVRVDEVTADACLVSSRLHQAVDCSLAQARAFVDTPNTWQIDLAELQRPMFFLPACVPVLLRYHHSWKQRLNRLGLPFQIAGWEGDEEMGRWGDAIAEPFRQRFTQALVLGDLLEAINFETAALRECDWMSWLTDCAVRYRSAPLIYEQYRAVLSALSVALSVQMNGCADPLPAEPAHQSFVIGVSSAIVHPESYVLSLRRLLDCASIQAAFSERRSAGLAVAPASNRQPEATDRSASVWVAIFAAGLLSGAWNGKCGLPALWQICSTADNQALLADDLFRLWSGQSLDRGIL